MGNRFCKSVAYGPTKLGADGLDNGQQCPFRACGGKSPLDPQLSSERKPRIRAAYSGSRLFLYALLSIVGALPLTTSRDGAASALAHYPVHTSSLDSLGDRCIRGMPTLEGYLHRAQMVAGNAHLVSYFLDNVPSRVDASTLPKTARDVVVARVRIVGRPSYLVGRDQSGGPSLEPRPKNLFHSRLKILKVESGKATVGSTVDATFGLPTSSGLRNYHPYTPEQLDRDYFVVMYTDDDGRARLAGFAIGESEYQLWKSEAEKYDRQRR